MKRINARILIILGFLIPLGMSQALGQGATLQGFSVRLSGGALSYFGDLSTNNANLPSRIINGSKFGFGAGIIKQFSPYFGIQAQFTAGSLYTEASDNTYFAGSLNEFSLSARFDPLKLIRKNNFRLSPYLSAGVGTFGYRSVRRVMYTNVVLLPDFGYAEDGITKADLKTALSMPLAIGLSYKVLPNLNIELEHSLRLTNSDLLDCFKGPSTASDLYSLTSIGLRYSIRTRSNGNQPKIVQETPAVKEKPAEALPPYPKTSITVESSLPENLLVGKSYDATIEISKGKYQGPATLQQKFPKGITAVPDPSGNVPTSFTNHTLIVEWDKMPADTIIRFKYSVKIEEPMEGSFLVLGSLEYVQSSGETKKVPFNKTVFIENPAKTAGNEVPITGLLRQYDDEAKDNAAPVTKGNIKQSTPLEGIEFRVQCGAFRDKKSADTQLAVRYQIRETIQEEFTDGWYKYTVGSFRTYEEAARYRDTFIERTRILSAFLVAYKDGRRLANINEALK